MKALKSNFYLIRVDSNPVYAGYTNRSIKTRFREHLNDKDFGDGNVTVEELDSLSFPFTWDINVINQYAQEVSDRETSLIAEYGTGDSVWQKGINGNIGGQVWNDVKNFVRTNRDNPKFAGMDKSEILAYLDSDNLIKTYMHSFVSNANDSVKDYMKDFVSHIGDPTKIYMVHFVSHIGDPVKIYMVTFVGSINDPVKIYMHSFVNNANDSVKYYMHGFVGSINDPVKIYIKGFVSSINDSVKIYIKSFVSRIDDPTKIYMSHFVSHMQNKQ